MQKVLGFGGFFFRSTDHEGLAKWYYDVLGISLVPQTAEEIPWIAEGGATVFAPFSSDTSYFAADKSFMLNFRVGDIDAMIAQIEEAGTPVTRLEDMPGIGKFAHLTDPEGTPIEIWQPE
ncbi:MAG: VOC family protein [Paracoccaceae bacterium]